MTESEICERWDLLPSEMPELRKAVQEFCGTREEFITFMRYQLRGDDESDFFVSLAQAMWTLARGDD